MAAFAGLGLRVLIVEDASFFRTALTSMLGTLGITQVDAVANGNAAIEACRNREYAIILSDFDSGKTGQQVLEPSPIELLAPEFVYHYYW